MFVPRAVQRKPAQHVGQSRKQTTVSRGEGKLVIRDLRAGSKEGPDDPSSPPKVYL